MWDDIKRALHKCLDNSSLYKLKIKNTEQTILVLNFFYCPNRLCVCLCLSVSLCVCVCVRACVSSELFVKVYHVLLLQIDGCWCGPHWPSLVQG